MDSCGWIWFFDLSVIVFRGQTKLALIVLCTCFRFLDSYVFFRLVFIHGSNCIYCFILYFEVLNCQEVKLSINTALSILARLPSSPKKNSACIKNKSVFTLFITRLFCSICWKRPWWQFNSSCVLEVISRCS